MIDPVNFKKKGFTNFIKPSFAQNINKSLIAQIKKFFLSNYKAKLKITLTASYPPNTKISMR